MQHPELDSWKADRYIIGNALHVYIPWKDFSDIFNGYPVCIPERYVTSENGLEEETVRTWAWDVSVFAGSISS